MAAPRLGEDSWNGMHQRRDEVASTLAFAVHESGHWSAHATVGFQGERCKAALARPQPQPEDDCRKWRFAAVWMNSPNRQISRGNGSKVRSRSRCCANCKTQRTGV